jgi:hypothetical protein
MVSGRTLLPMPGAPKMIMTRAMQEQPNGATRLEQRDIVLARERDELLAR